MASITAIIPVYNRAFVVGRALESIFTQELPDGDSLAVVVVDDGSSDELAQALKPFGNRLTCITHPRNLGAAAARNTGIASVREGYVAFLDSDDSWKPGKLLMQLSIMRKQRWPASCTAYYLARDNHRPIVSPGYETGALGASELAWGCFVSPGSTLVAERQAFESTGVFDTSLPRLEDWDWLLRYARIHRFGFVAEPLSFIDPSKNVDSAKVLSALKIIHQKHLTSFEGPSRRYFTAGIDFERAAALVRRGNLVGAVPSLIASLLRSPFRHDALKAVLQNRSGGARRHSPKTS